MLNKYYHKLQAADVISFDIFDTLLARQTAHPTDVFAVAQEMLNHSSIYHMSDDFRKLRIDAERLARQATQNVDITLDDIYDVLGEVTTYDKSFLDELMRYELEAEEALLSRDPSVTPIYNEAKRLKKKIVIVSDMYLPRGFIEKVLRKNGIDGWDRLILSCDDNVGKYCGSAFAKLIALYPEKKILHVGDNEWSDIAWSNAFGLDSIHIHRNIEAASFEKHAPYRAIYGGRRFRWTSDDHTYETSDLQFNIISGMTVNYLADSKRGVPEAIGYGVFGPLLLALTQWIERTAYEEGIEQLYYLARDGAIIQRAHDEYFGDKGVKGTYTYGSRRILNFPNIFEHIGEKEINTLTATDQVLDVAKTLTKFGLDPDDMETKKAFHKVGLTTNDIVRVGPDMERVKAALLLISGKVISSAKNERLRLVDYLNSIGMTKPNRKIAICDIGWHGSMQMALMRLLNKDIIGLYFGIHANNNTNRLANQMKGFFDSRAQLGADDSYKDVIASGVEVIEFLFTNPDQASLVGIAQSPSGGYLPVEGEHDSSQEARDLLAAIQSSAIDFVKDFKSMTNKLPPSLLTLDRDVAFRALKWVIEEPSDMVAIAIGSVQHSFAAGSISRYIGRPMHSAHYYRKHPDALRREFDEAFWKQGFIKNLQVSHIPFNQD